MGQLSTYTDRNKITYRGLAIRYRVTPRYVGDIKRPMIIDATGADGTTLYEVARYATKSYAYVGLTKAAAKACRDSKIAKYTRVHLDDTEWDSTSIWDESRNCGAAVEISSVGSSYKVSIEVNETDVLYFAARPTDNIETVFARRLGSLDYDEGDVPTVSPDFSRVRTVSELAVTYEMNPATFWKEYIFARTARKTYEYFGLDYPTAKAVAAAKVEKYTRAYSLIDFRDNIATVGTVTSLTSEVSIEREDDLHYKVVVSVNERDEKIKEGAEMGDLFDAENARDYD